MLKNFIEGIKDVLPAVAGTIGYAVAGPAGAAIGSGIGSLVRGDEGQEALQNAMLAGALGYGGQKFLSGGSGPIGQFFSQGKIPGVVGGDTGILKAFGERSFSPGMTNLGFGGKYLPTETVEAARTIGGTPVYTSGEAGYGTVMSGGQNISGATLKEFDALKALGTGDSESVLLQKAKENVLGGKTIAKDPGIMAKFFEFAKANPELILGGLTLAQTSGFFDEGELDELPRGPEPGSQGSLPTSMAGIMQPVAGQGGLYTYNVKNGGIMRAKQGEQVKQKLTDEQRDMMDDYLLNKMMREFYESMMNRKMNEEQYKPRFDMQGKEILGAKEGSIASFEQNSPRRDLFLEREGPISDDRGSPNKDTVYAKLADGEFVVNADTVADIGYGMGARNLADAKDLGGSFFYGLQDAQKKGILGNMVGMA
jgi:hypothetical protein